LQRRSQTGNSELVSRVNSRLVLQAIRLMQPTFRAEVARATHLTPAAVTGIVNELSSQDLVRKVAASDDTASSRNGRPPSMLRVNGAYGHILAIDLEPDCIRVAVTDLLVETVAYREQLIDRFARPEPVLETMVKLCRQVIEEAGLEAATLIGASMSLPGMIDAEAGKLMHSTNMPQWHDVAVADELEKALGVRPQVARSLHLAAVYEGWRHPEHSEETVIVLSLRTGIGYSVLHQGELQIGWGGFGGEIGHTLIDQDGPTCECGSRGCLETFVSASAIVARVHRLWEQGRGQHLKQVVEDTGAPLTPELIYRCAKQGDRESQQVVQEVGRYIGIAAANLVNLFAPDRLVLCGAIDTADDLILDAVRQQVRAQALPKLREHVALGLSAAKERSPLLGAAATVANAFFELPRLRHPKLRLDMARDPDAQPALARG